jgi:hypothetical protein
VASAFILQAKTGKEPLAMQHMDPNRLRLRAAEYRALARTCRTAEDKTAYLKLAERLIALADSELCGGSPSRKAPKDVPRPKRRTYRFGMTAA